MGLVIMLLRVAILGGIVFGLVFGVVYARRSAAHRKRLEDIQRELQALRAGLENGTYARPEFDALTADIYRKCEEEGIQVPRLDETNDQST